MKTVRLGPGAIFHRYLTPKWAFTPLSGAGAALDGGRFNRPGVEALYLSRSAQTAHEEYLQGASITPPATLAAYLITLDPVADFSSGHDQGAGEPSWAAWNCNWRQIARIEKAEPPTWILADSLMTDGFKGLLFPSLRHDGGINLVIFAAKLAPSDTIEVHDPEGLLPKDQMSWPSVS